MTRQLYCFGPPAKGYRFFFVALHCFGSFALIGAVVAVTVGHADEGDAWSVQSSPTSARK